MNKDMKKRLESFINTDKLMSVYTDADEPNSFTLGFPLQMDEDNILFNMVNAYGEENGFCSINLDDIFIYDNDKLYSDKIFKLFTIQNQNRKHIEELDKSVVITLLKYAQDNKLLVQLNKDNSYVGFVSYFSEETIELNIIDMYAQDLGIACIDMNNVNIIECQTKSLKALEMLIQCDYK